MSKDNVRLIPIYTEQSTKAKASITLQLAGLYQQANCFNCEYGHERGTYDVVCSKSNFATPPPRIVAYGCEHHDYIPF